MNGLRRKPPMVKLWWMVACIALTILVMLASGIMFGFRWIIVSNALASSVVNILIALGVALTYAAGGLDLSFFGVYALCGAIFASCISTGMGGAAVALTLLAGLAIGAVNGLCARLVADVNRWLCAIVSLLLGVVAFIANVVILRGTLKTGSVTFWMVPVSRDSILLFLLLAVLVCVLFGFTPGGKRLFARRSDKTPTKRITAGGLIAHCVAGFLVATAMVVQSMRLRAVMTVPNAFQCFYSALPVLTILAVAAIGIPNLRETRGEAFAGLLSVCFGGIFLSMLTTLITLVRVTSFAILVLEAVLLVIFGLVGGLIAHAMNKREWSPAGVAGAAESGAAQGTLVPGNKSKAAAALMAFFIGGTGAHRYYLGYTKSAIAQTCGGVSSFIAVIMGGSFAAARSEGGLIFAGILLLYGSAVGIWAFVDFIRILANGLRPANGSAYSGGYVPPVQPQPAPSPANATVEALESLKKLLDQGILTEEEYQRKRAELVSKL